MCVSEGVQALVGTKDDWQLLEARVGFRGLQSIRYIYKCCVPNKGNYLYFRISPISLQYFNEYPIYQLLYFSIVPDFCNYTKVLLNDTVAAHESEDISKNVAKIRLSVNKFFY